MNSIQARSPNFIAKLHRILWPLIKFFYRIEVTGLEHIKNRPSLLIANHNSGALIESHSLLFLLAEQGIDCYGFNHKALFQIPFVCDYFKKIGGVPATREIAKSVLQSGFPLLIFPGGNRQALRPLVQKNKNSFPWAKGWSEIASENQVPVIPIKFIGTHELNPILLSSKFLSSLLVLPRVLGVTWFPISLAQIVFSLISFILGLVFSWPWFLTFLVVYLSFCFSVLVPLVPRKVKIKIYPPIQPQDGTQKNEEEVLNLRNKMELLMDKIDFPEGPRKVYPLNAIERFMLYNEHKNLSYNSQLIFEFSSDVNRRSVLETTRKWIEHLPQLRSVVSNSDLYPQRFIYERSWFEPEDVFEFQYRICDEKRDLFCQKKFQLGFEPGFRFLLQSEGAQQRLVFSCHHSLFDGAGQSFAFEVWLKLFRNQMPPEALRHVCGFHFRELRHQMGLKKFYSLLWKNFRLSPPRQMRGVAHLNTGVDLGNRLVKSKTLRLPDLQRDEAVALVLESFHNTLEKKGDFHRPIFAVVPVGLRWTLKIKNSLQNAVISTGIFLKREAFQSDSWREKIQRRLSQDPVQQNEKFIFGTLMPSSLIPAFRLRQKFAQWDRPDSEQSSSLLIVQAPIPQSFPFPAEWIDLTVSARGTLLKSPGLGVIVTGQKKSPTLTLEYLEGLVSEDDADLFMEELKKTFNNSWTKSLKRPLTDLSTESLAGVSHVTTRDAPLFH